MTEQITHRKSLLPVKLEDLTRFVLIGREKLVAVKAAIRAIDKIGLAKDVREQKLGEGQELGGALLDAEARIGELLKDLPSPAGSKIGKRGVEKTLPTGITHKLSHQCQQLAEYPALIEQVKAEAVENEDIPTRSEVLRKIKEKKREEYRQAIINKGKYVPESEKWHIEVGNIITYQTKKKFDFVITDPPYSKEYLELYEILAQRANDWLVFGGLLIVMCGQSYLDWIIEQMSKYLKYYWTGCYLTPGQPTPMRIKQVNTTWKPILFFVRKGEKYTGKIFGDVFKSDLPEKAAHDWGQSISGMSSIIKGVCLPGQSIFDPFLGAGATGIAALGNGCFFTGIDINEDCINLSKGRLNDYVAKR
jgi:16S rRNA G966 N2-methylase RsmD